MAIPKSLRIPSRSLRLLFRNGRKLRFNSFTLVVNTQATQTVSRVAVSVSKKIDKRATVRNHLKRLLYSAYKSVAEKNVLKPTDIIVIAVKTISGKTQQDLENEFYQAFTKTGLINDKKTVA